MLKGLKTLHGTGPESNEDFEYEAATLKRNYRLDRASFMDLLSKITLDLAPQPNQVCDDANVDPVANTTCNHVANVG